MPKIRPEACMICTPDPCECFAPKSKVKPRPKKSRPAAPEVVEVAAPPLPDQRERQDLRAKMKAAAANAPRVAIRVQQTERQHRRKIETDMVRPAPAIRPVISDDQLLLNAALRALGDILAPEECEQYKMIIGSSPSADERKAEWKARRRAYVDS